MKGLLPSYSPCFFCGRVPDGLALELQYRNGVVSCEFSARQIFQGYKGLLHGGIITGILDEVMFWTVFTEVKEICATWKIEVEFRRPVVCGETYQASGHFNRVGNEAGYLATGLIEDESGRSCAIGRASFRRMKGVTLGSLLEQLDFGRVPPEIRSLFDSMGK